LQERLLDEMAALDELGDTPEAEAARAAVRARASAAGLSLLSFTITEEPIPDPLIERLPRKQRDRIERVSHRMFEDPAPLVAELEELVAQHPGIPMLRNHLAGALQASGQAERAAALIEETARLFPDYLFGFTNRVVWLVQGGRLDEARALLEPEGGPSRMSFAAFDPGREVFHLTEVVCYTATVGHYLLSTGRRREAERQLAMCREIAPGHPQTLALEERIERVRVLEVVRGAAARLLEGRGKKARGRGKKKG
jgi:predicted Zn-dependent protease